MEEIRDNNSKIFHKLLEDNLKKNGLDVKRGVNIYYYIFRFVEHQIYLLTSTIDFTANKIVIIIPYLINILSKNKRNHIYMNRYKAKLKKQNNE